MNAYPAPIPVRRRVFVLGVLILITALGGEAIRAVAGWPGFVTAATVSALGAIALLVSRRPRIRLAQLPWTLVAFMLLALASLTWSQYPSATALTLVGQWVGALSGGALILCLGWRQFARVLALACKILLGVSLIFELLVALFIRHPILPPFMSAHEGPETPLMMWSRNLLFSWDRIQGIVGNSNELGFIALVGLIVFGIAVWAKAVGPRIGWVWVALALFMLIRSGSATVLACALACAAALGAILLTRAASSPRVRAWLYGLYAAVVAIIVVLLTFARGPVLEALGRRSDLTGRTEAWEHVTELANQHPTVGWGFSSPWIPWVSPFDRIWQSHGVTQLQANNAWLDTFFQLGWIGAVLLALSMLGALWRAWFYAVDHSFARPRTPKPHDPFETLPLLLGVVLLVQTFAESALLYQGGWLLFVVLALGSAIHRRSPAAP